MRKTFASLVLSFFCYLISASSVAVPPITRSDGAVTAKVASNQHPVEELAKHPHHHHLAHRGHPHHWHSHHVETHHWHLPGQNMTQVSSDMPFRQATNGSTPAGWIQMGTPKKWLLVIFDTGSDKLVAKTWETLKTELASIDQGIDGMVLPSAMVYDHNASSSYKVQYAKDPRTNETKPKKASIMYGSGAAITDVGSDDVLVGNRPLNNFTLMEITADSLQLLHTSKGIAGVLGLQHMKNKSLGDSLFSRMRDQKLMTSFGYCRGKGDNGTFIWGDTATEGKELEVIGEMHWAVKLGSVRMDQDLNVNGSSLIAKRSSRPKHHKHRASAEPDSWPFSNDASAADEWPFGADDHDGDEWPFGSNSQDRNAWPFGSREDFEDPQADEDLSLDGVCADGKCTAILDTGSNIIAGPTDVIKKITSLAKVKPDCSNFNQLPDITMDFGGMPVTIHPSGYVMKVPMPSLSMGGPNGFDQGQAEGEDDGFGQGQAEAAGDGEGNGDGESGRGMEGAGEEGFADDGYIPGSSNVIIEVEPGSVRRHHHDGDIVLDVALAEKKVAAVRSATKRKWQAVFERLNRDYGVDLRDVIKDILQDMNHTSPEFLCMPALVPLDKHTKYGPLWVVGTPLLDSYYARWSFAQNSTAPKIHLKALEDAEVCSNTGNTHTGDAAPAGLMRTQKVAVDADAQMIAAARVAKKGPTARLPEEIRYPHWAKDLLHV